MKSAQRIAEDRKADLHYAFQFGQDAVRGDFAAVEAEFKTKFSGDTEAQANFDAGIAHERARNKAAH